MKRFVNKCCYSWLYHKRLIINTQIKWIFLVLDLKRTLSWLFRTPVRVRSLFVWCKMFKNHFHGFQMTSPKFKLRNYRFFWVLLSRGIAVLKHLYLYKFSVRKVLRFAIENDWMTRHLAGGLERYYMYLSFKKRYRFF